MRLTRLFFYLLLIIFPFGIIFRYLLVFGNVTIPVSLFEVVTIVLFGFELFYVFKSKKILPFERNWFIFCLFLGYTYLLNTLIAGVIYPRSFLYIIRMLVYLSIFSFLVRNSRLKIDLPKALVAIGICIGIFSWLIFLFFPDMRSMKYFGWDDHLYRLTGVFLDPAFTGLYLVLSLIFVVRKFLHKKKIADLIFMLFFLISIAFTYSRGVYLSLTAGMITLFYIKKKLKYGLFILVFAAMLIFLPRSAGEGVKLERVFSIRSRIESYQQGLKMFSQNPVFGVGYNNYCLALKNKNNVSLSSHACWGSDSSLITLLATSGIIGVFIFGGVIASLLNSVKKSNRDLVYPSLVVVFTHSFFNNSLFFSWTLFWLFCLCGISLKANNGR